MNNQLATHEVLEIHELMNFKNTCINKTASMYNLASCEQLKALMEADIQNSAQAIADYKNILSRVQ
ncbi:spore coat protein [Paenibacillus alvei]|uniref:spore coat protein n=1 Tax=Paenibacillus alvei TaxID=44250 RepID=UPI0019EFCFA5|nr:spore coat protein [Paenibacillus alvei]